MKSLTKTLMLFLTAAVLVLAGCSKQEAGSVDAESQMAESYLVYLVTMDKQDQHWVAVKDGAEQMAAKLGVTYKWEAPDTKDAAKQSNVINNAVADGADAILLASLSPTALDATVRQAIQSGVKILYVDSPASEPAVAQLLTNNYNAGALAAQTMIDELGKAGITSGAIGVVDVDGVTQSTVDRVAGFRSVMDAQSAYTLENNNVDSTSNGDAAQAQNIATNMLNADSDIIGLFGSNEGTTVGVGNAVKEFSGRTVIGIGFDKSNRIEALLGSGDLKAVMAQNPFTMGYLGMAQAYAALSGLSTGPATIDTGVSVVR